MIKHINLLERAHTASLGYGDFNGVPGTDFCADVEAYLKETACGLGEGNPNEDECCAARQALNRLKLGSNKPLPAQVIYSTSEGKKRGETPETTDEELSKWIDSHIRLGIEPDQKLFKPLLLVEHAWKVVAYMRTQGWHITIVNTETATPDAPQSWGVYLDRTVTECSKCGSATFIGGEGEHTDIKKAICLAAKAAAEDQLDHVKKRACNNA